MVPEMPYALSGQGPFPQVSPGSGGLSDPLEKPWAMRVGPRPPVFTQKLICLVSLGELVSWGPGVSAAQGAQGLGSSLDSSPILAINVAESKTRAS